MKVKIGDTVYDAEDEPIMVILNDADKKNIAGMKHETKYCCFPNDCTEDEVNEFMKTK